MGVPEEQLQGSPRHACRATRPKRAALVGLATSLAVLVAIPAAVVATRVDPSIGARPSVSVPAEPGSFSGRPAADPTPASQDGRPGDLSIAVGPATPERPADVARPTRVRVNSVGIDAAVDPTGVEPDGTVVIPADAYRVGWYRFGPAPGNNRGSAVLVGHVDSRTQGRGALYPLRGVHVGDRVVVTVADRAGLGRDVVYRVVARESINKQRVPFAELFGRSGSPRLTLITCGGAYVKERGGYQDNLVVTAVPDGQEPS